MNPLDNDGLEEGYEGSGYNSSLELGPAVISPKSEAVNNKKIRPTLAFNKTTLLISSATVLFILVVGLGSYGISTLTSRASSSSPENIDQLAAAYGGGSLNLQNLKQSSQLNVGETDHLSINGILQVNKTIVLTPTTTPSNPTTGQIYYNQTSNLPYYYNGSQFIGLVSSSPQGVTSISGSSGAVVLGNGLQIAGNQLAISSSFLQRVSALGINGPTVTSVQGFSGKISIIGTGNQVVVSAASGNVSLSLPQSIGLNSNVQFGSLALGSGDLTLTPSALLNTDNISTINNGDSLVINSGNNITFENSNGANSFVFPTSGGPGQTICTTGISCASGGGQAVILEPNSVQTANSNHTALFINKASGTGNLAELQANGIDAFVINNGGDTTISNLDVSDVLNANNIVPTGPFTIGASNSNFTLQGATNSTITSTGSGITTTLGFSEGSGGTAPNGNVIYQLQNNNTIPAGTYSICTTVGNCSGAVGVESLDLLTGTLALANSSGSGSTVTIDDASTVAKGIAEFNATNFTAGGGIVNTVQNINSAATPTFGGLTLGTALSVANGGSGDSTLGINGILFGNNANAIQVTSAAANSVLATNGTDVPSLVQTLPFGVQTNISRTGTLTTGSIGSGFGAISTGNNITTTSAIQGGSLNIASGAFSVDGSGNVTTTGTATVQGAGGLTLGVAGPSGTTGSLTFLNSTDATTGQFGFAAQTDNLIVTVPNDTHGNDNVCLETLANCVGTGGGVAGTGTSGDVAVFTGTSNIGNSNIFESGSDVSVGDATPSALFNVGNSNQFQVTAAGAVLAVGVNAGSGSIQGTGGLNVTGAASISGGLNNNSGNITNVGSLTGVTGITASGNINTTAGAFELNGSSINTGGVLNNVAYLNQDNTFTAAGTDITVNNDEVVGGTLTVQSSTGLVLGVAGPSGTTGSLVLDNSGNSHSTTLQGLSSATQNQTITIPVSTATTDQICLLTLANCSGSNGGSGNTNYIENQTSPQGNANFNIQGIGGSVSAVIEGAAGQDIADFDNSSGGILYAFNATGNINIGVAGPSGTTGSLTFLNSTDATTGQFGFAAQTDNLIVTVPNDTHGNDNVCLETLANCVGTGGGVAGTGTSGDVAVFTGTSNIGNSNIFESGSDVSVGDATPSALFNVGNSNQFQVTAAGAVLAVGVNAGSGSIQGTGGLNVTGAASISGGLNNNSGNITNVGSLTGVTGITASGNINTTAGAFELNGSSINTGGVLNNVAYLNQDNTFTAAGTDITVNNDEVVGGTLTVQSSTGLVLGVAGPSGTTGSITLLNSTNSDTVTLQTLAQGNNLSITIPVDANSGDVICLQALNNCSGGGTSIVQVPTLNSGSGNVAGDNLIDPTTSGIIGLTVNATTSVTSSAVAAVFNQADTGGETTPGDTVQINSTNATGSTQVNGLLVARNGTGTTTNLLNLTNTAGTVTNGLTLTATSNIATGIDFNGTAANFGTDLINTSTGNFSLTSAGVETLQGNQTADLTTATPSNVGNKLTIAPGVTTAAATTGAGTFVTGGTAGTTGTGGLLTLQGGAASATSGSSGGGVTVVGAAGTGTGNGGTVSIQGGTGTTAGAVNIGTTSASTVGIGNNTSGTAVNVQAGTGNLSLQSTGAVNIDTNNVANTVQIGDTTNTVAQTIAIGNGGSTGTDAVTIGSLISTSLTTIQGGTTGTGAIALQAGTGGLITIGSQTASTVNTVDVGAVGSTTNADAVNINSTTGANAGNTTIGGTNNTGNLLLQGEGISETFVGSATAPSETIKTTVNSASAFQIQNSGNNSELTVDTSGNQVVLGKANTGGLNGTLEFLNNSNTNTATLQTGVTTGTYSLTLPTAGVSGSSCLESSSGSTTSATALQFGTCTGPKSVTKIVAMGTPSGCGGAAPVASSNPSAADFLVPGTSCTTADVTIQSAISALPAGGGVVYLEDGTYIISSSITIPSNVTLEGAGADTIIKLENSFSGTINMLSVSGSVSNVLIQDLKIDGNKANQSTGTDVGININTSGSPGATITNDWVQNMYGTINGETGISLGSSGLDTISNTTVTGDGYDGIEDANSNSTISDTTSSSNGGYGYNISGNYVTLNGNQALSNTSFGFNDSGANNSFNGNTSKSNSNYGFYLGGNDLTVSNNISTANTSDGIEVPDSNSTISGNDVFNNAGNGIDIPLGGGTGDVISNNTISESSTGTTYGVYVATNNNSVTGNTIIGTGGSGNAIYIYAGAYNTYLSNNTYSGNGATTISDNGGNTEYADQISANNDIVLQGQGAIDIGSSAQGTGTLSVNGGIVTNQLATPGWGSLGGVSTVGGGSGTTWGYEITALDGTGETIGSTQKTTNGPASLSGVNYNNITFPIESGAVKYNVYRTTAPSTTGLVTTITAGTLSATNGTASQYTLGLIQWKDTGFTATTAIPTVNTSGGGSFSGQLLVKPATNIATALQVENSSSKSILSVDTAGNQVLLGTVGTSGQSGQIVFNSATSGNFAVTLNTSASETASYTLTLPTSGPGASQCLQSGASTFSQLTFGSCGGGSTTSLQQAYNNSAGAAPSIDMTSTNKGFTVQNDNSSPITGELFGVHASAGSGLGAGLFSVANTGDTTITSSDTTTTGTAALNVIANSVTTGDALAVSVNGLTTGFGESITSNSPSQTAGSLLSVSDNVTLATNAGTLSGQLVNVSRTLTANIPGGGSNTVTEDTTNGTYNFHTSSSGVSSPWSNSFDVGANSNRYLIVDIAEGDCQQPTGITYNSSSMTLFGSTAPMSDSSNGCLYTYGLAAPSTGNNNIVVTPFGGLPSVYEMTVSSWYNVSSVGTYTGSNGTTTSSVSVSAVSVSGQAVVDAYAEFVGSTGSPATPGGGQTQISSVEDEVNTNMEMGMSYKAAVGTNTTMSWSGLTPDITYINSEAALGLNPTSTSVAETVSSPVASFSNSCSLTAGTCTDASNVLSLNQQYTAATGAVLNIQNAGTGDMLDLVSGSTTVVKINNNGGATFEDDVSGGSTTAFQVQNTGGNDVLNVDTADGYVIIGAGSVTHSTTADLLVLDNSSDTTEPTEVNGAMYYNSNTSSFRCGVNSSWQSCGPITGIVASDVPVSNTSAIDVTGLTFPVAASTNYTLSCNLVYQTAATTTGIRLGLNGPSSPTLVSGGFNTYVANAGSQSLVGSFFTAYGATTGTTAVGTANTNTPATLEATFRNGTTAGTLAVRVASSATSTVTIKAGSSCKLTQL